MTDWESLRKLTQARIGLGRAGHAVPTTAHLKFQLDHARARDAVHWAWDLQEFKKQLRRAQMPSIVLKTPVKDRFEYLTRPDLGKKLEPLELNKLKSPSRLKSDIAIVVSNGLSSSAVNQHGFSFLELLWAELKESHFKLAPICLVENARVALSDVIGSELKAKMVLMILGERPGLSSFDSLALYLTYRPRPGNTDAGRNCVSNIRPPDGLSYSFAIKKTLFLVKEAFRRRLSGVDLKEEAKLLV
jgi:ethanolamine ammonia-lyase small subunit